MLMKFIVLVKREFELQWKTALLSGVVCLGSMFLLLIVTNPDDLGKGPFDSFANALPIAFAIACAGILIGLVLTMNLMCKDYNMIHRELRMGIHSTIIVLSKTLFVLIVCAILSLILVGPYLINMYEEYELKLNKPLLFLSVFATMSTSSVLGLFVSTVVKDSSQKAAIALPFIILFQILFSDFVFNGVLDKLRDCNHKSYISWISISNYSIRAIGMALGFYETDNINAGMGRHGELDVFANTKENIFSIFFILIIMFLLATVATIIFLYCVDKRKIS